ncbi:MAG: hypothetical protein GEU90_01850 [Gemmatimonas sp.]|nr:hypothetical protein [Gemmatimonas sp.]
MKRAKSVALAASGALFLSVIGLEAQSSEVELTGNVSIASDYTFRGVSQTLEEPAVQGGLDLAFPFDLYAGAWGSSVNFGEDLPRAQMELDFYGGIAPSVAGFDLDLGGIYYLYPGADDNNNYDFLELYGGAGRSIGPVGLGISGAYSPDFFGASGTGIWLGADASVGIPETPVTIDVSIGQQSVEDNSTWGTPDYMAWTAGLGAEVMGASIGAMVTGTDLDEGDCFSGTDLCNTRVIVSVGRDF